MVGYTVNTGSSEEFADGWDRVFGGKKGKARAKQKKASSEDGRKTSSRKSAIGRAKSAKAVKKKRASKRSAKK